MYIRVDAYEGKGKRLNQKSVCRVTTDATNNRKE